MVESLIVLLFLVAAFLFLYDFAFGAVARLLLENGAASAARADAVGLNGFQREKSLRVGMIPVSGRRLVPGDGRAVAPGAGELALVRTYLQARDWAEADGILDYEGWRGLSHDVRRSGGTCRVRAAFDQRLERFERRGFSGVAEHGEGNERAFVFRFQGRKKFVVSHFCIQKKNGFKV